MGALALDGDAQPRKVADSVEWSFESSGPGAQGRALSASSHGYGYQYQYEYQYQYQYEYEYQYPTPAVSNVSISATDDLIRQDETTQITWSSNNADTCSVSEDNPNINDSWGGTSGSEETSELETETVYTVQCSNAVSSGSDTGTVQIIPQYRRES